MTTASFQSIAVACAIGLLAGTHAAVWGMYKDSVYEGFGRGRFIRSIGLGGVSAALLQMTFRLPLPGSAAVVLLFGMAYATERTVVELWKTFVRQEDQSKYFIPMQFSVRGVPLASRRARLLVGVACVAALAACLALIATLDRSAGSLSRPVQAALVGLAAGTLVAIGGCWKDAPTEGFDRLKFFRSPTVALSCALAFAWLTTSYLHIAIASVGFERAAVETYKTFIASKPPGKFFGKPILHPHMIERRRRFVPLYVAISAGICVMATFATSAGIAGVG
jgi:hypothetical protein